MRKSKVLLLMLFAGRMITYGQTNTLPKVIPPSPVTHEFEKYINYNVSPYNGVPDISIPLYNIQLKGATIPISLSYHASGIKYKQESGEVGVGWNFNPGYRISRTVYGRADERYQMPSNLYDSVTYYSNDPNKRDRYLSKFIWDGSGTNNSPYPYSTTSTSLLDGEYDVFNYMLPSVSGSFIIKDRVNKQVQALETNNVKFNYTVGNSATSTLAGSILSFDVVDEDGIEYLFGEDTSTVTNIFETTSQYGGYLATAWGLSRVVTPLGDQVDFKYVPGTVGAWDGQNKTLNVVEAAICVNAGDNTHPSTHSATDGTEGTYSTFFVDEINSPNEKIKVIRQTGANFISEIRISTIDDVLLKTIKFSYSGNIFHTFLDTVRIYDANQNAIQTYSFDYYDKTVSSSSDFTQDQWGYYLPTSQPAPDFHQEFYDDLIVTQAGSSAEILGQLDGQYGFEYRDTSNVFNPEMFTLKSVTYPTGGKTTYEYESNKYLKEDGQIRRGGGMRIKKIYSDDGINDNILIREYVYGDNECGYGVAQLSLNHTMFVDEQLNLVYTTDPILTPQRIINYSTNVQGDISGAGFLSSYVRYPVVTEYYRASNASSDNGKVVYKYDLPSTLSVNSYYTNKNLTCGPTLQYLNVNGGPLYINSYELANQPVLREKKTFSIVNGEANAVSLEEFQYTNTFSTFTGLKVRPFATMENYIPGLTGWDDPYNLINSFFRYGQYSVEVATHLLSQKKQTVYGPNSSAITAITDYAYNSKNQLIQTIVHNSTGLNIEEFSYPTSFTGLSSSDPVKSLENKNILNAIIEDRKYRANTDGTNKRLVSSNYTEYTSPLSLPLKTYSAKISAAVTNFSAASVSNGAIVKDSRYEVDVNFNQYDSKGNILEVQKQNDIPIAYVWGYNNTYPVAEVRGASYYTVIANAGLNQSVIQSTSTGDASMRTELNKIRTVFPSALVTTYTYKPLVGMTSATDANGRTTYYEYDAFGRLSLIRDQNNKILKKYCYNYAGQQEQCSVFESASINRYYYSQNCPPGQTPQPYYVSLPVGQFTSTVSQTDADQQAQQYAQGQANQNGTCQQASVTLYYSNNAGTNFMIDLYNTSTGEEFWMDAYSFSSGILGNVPQGTYYIAISPYDYNGFYSYSAGCGYYSSGNQVTFYDVPLNSSCNNISMY